MFKIFFLLPLVIFSSFCREIPILDPQDPEFVWMDTLIERDFSALPAPLLGKRLKRRLHLYERHPCILCFHIHNNQVIGPDCACKQMLEYLCRVYGLEDLSFLYWNQDGLWESFLPGVPILAGARSVGVENVILFGDWLYAIDNPQGPWNGDIDRIDAAAISWEQKSAKLFWRGAATDIWSGGSYSVKNWSSHTRGKACALSLEFPELIDAGFTAFLPFLCKDGDKGAAQLARVAPMGSYASLQDHLQYKYQLQITGVMANFPRDRWQFYSDSLVFRHDPPHEMFWYSLIQPWDHYVPVDIGLSDLVEKIHWAIAHEDESKEIARHAKHFAQTHFMPEHIALYCYKVLKKYASSPLFSQALAGIDLEQWNTKRAE